ASRASTASPLIGRGAGGHTGRERWSRIRLPGGFVGGCRVRPAASILWLLDRPARFLATEGDVMDAEHEQRHRKRLTRRRSIMAMAGLTLATAALLAACGGSSSSSSAPATTTGSSTTTSGGSTTTG